MEKITSCYSIGNPNLEMRKRAILAFDENALSHCETYEYDDYSDSAMTVSNAVKISGNPETQNFGNEQYQCIKGDLTVSVSNGAPSWKPHSQTFPRFHITTLYGDSLPTPIPITTREIAAGNGDHGEGIRFGGLKVLALDLGTKTGWASLNAAGQIHSGVENFKPSRFESSGMRFHKFRQWLTESKARLNGIDLVVFEEVRRHAGVDAAHAYGGFMGNLQSWCEHHQIDYGSTAVGTIKKFITGKGNAGKQAVIHAVKALGHNPEDDNEADAIALLHYAIQQHNIGRSA